MEKVREKVLFALQEVQRAVIGKQEVTETVMKAFLAGGHVLVEDIPGLGKTTMAIAFSRAIGLQKRRVQFTPDVLPSDLTGFTIYQKERNAFVYHPGAVVCNLLLADEINRASPKTQSALLEVMEEGQVTVDGKTRKIAPPFLVIATENPSGSAGTQLLPESQLDRFMMRLSLGYPDEMSEIEIINRKKSGNPINSINPVLSPQELLMMQEAVTKIHLDESLVKYIVQIVQQTRIHEKIELGASPRASIALMKAAQASAYLNGRDYVIVEDINENLYETLNHRIFLMPSVKKNRENFQIIMEDIMMKIAPIAYK